MKLAVMELECHAEVLRNTVLLLRHLPKLEVTIYSTIEIWEETALDFHEYPSIRVVLKPANQSVQLFLEEKREEINGHFWLLFNTIQENFGLIDQLKLEISIWVRVHNSNFYFAEQKHRVPDYSRGGLTLSLKKWIRRENKHKQRFLEQVERFLFPNQAMSDFAMQEYQLDAERIQLPPLPLVHYKENSEMAENRDSFRIVVVGTLDPVRRDYEFLQLVLQKWLVLVSKPVELILLGAGEGKNAEKIKADLHAVASDKLKIRTYPKLVNQLEFDEQIQRADVLFSPLKLNTSFHVSPERYGQTKVSGGVNDGIAAGKKIILPAAYGMESDLKDFLLPYTNVDDCVEILQQLENGSISKRPTLPEESYYRLENQIKILKAFFLAHNDL